MCLNTTISIAIKLDGLGLEKLNINNIKTRQTEERLPQPLISQVLQYYFVNYHKWVDFPNSWTK